MHTHTQSFYGPLFGTTWVSHTRKKHSPTQTYPDHQPSFISFLRLLRSITSSLFNLCASQSFWTTSPIFTGFQCPLWLVSFLLLVLTNPAFYDFSSFFSAAATSSISDAICLFFFNSGRYPLIPFIFFIHQFRVLFLRVFNPFFVYNLIAWCCFQTVWRCYILSFFYHLLCCLKNFILLLTII